MLIILANSIQPAYAALIHVPFNGTACCIGEYNPITGVASYWAQTFYAPSEKVGDLKIWGLNNEQYPGSVFDFRLLITATNSDYGFQPTSVLYESPKVSLNNQFITGLTFDLSQLTFAQGTKYAFVIDSYVTRDGLIDIGQFMVNTNPDAYPAGGSYALIATGNGRPADLNARWNLMDNLTISFSLDATNAVSAIPEPETYSLLLAGLAVVGAAAKRRNAH